jgi:hypothetical protein
VDRERVRSIAAVAVAIVIAVVPAAGRQIARAGGVPVRHAVAGGPVPGLAGSGAVLSTLPGVSAASPDDAWAVGYQALAPSGPTDTVTEHWNGRS